MEERVGILRVKATLGGYALEVEGPLTVFEWLYALDSMKLEILTRMKSKKGADAIARQIDRILEK